MSGQVVVTAAVGTGHELVGQMVTRAISRHDGMRLAGRARDGASALALVEREQPHVVLLDVDLPGPDGLTVCRRLTGPHGPSCKVIVLDGAGDLEATKRARHAGATACLPRAVLTPELYETILAVARR